MKWINKRANCFDEKIEIEDGGDVAQASSQDAKADEGQGVTEMCNLSGIKFKPKEENSLQMALLFVCDSLKMYNSRYFAI